MLAERERLGAQPFGGHPMANLRSELLGDDEYDGLVGRVSQVNGLCMAATGKAFDLALLRMTQAMAAAALQDDDDEDDDDEDENGKEKKKTKKKKKKSNEDLLDGMPAKFIGPLLADLVAHEVGHTLGLRHNFKASSLYTLEQINSDEVAGKKPFTSSVMDYTPININMDENATQGDYAMIAVGPYDMWAIEYGYTFDKDLKPILARCTEPENQYLTDEDTSGPDPLARRYDFSADPLTYANNQAQLALHHRERILSRFVNDGDSWAKARQGYDFTLGLQFRAVSMMANWLGGAFVNRDKKGDTLPGSEESRPPITVVSAKKQRDALRFIIEHTFADDAFGLTPELLQHMTVDKWFDGGGRAALFQDATYPLHDRIMGIQASVLTRIMNPTTLGRIYDNEYRTMNGDDSLTLPEVMESVLSEIWKELGDMPSGRYSARQPLISSMRRNLQRESIDRLIGLTMQSTGGTAAFRAISSLSLMHLSRIQERIQRAAAKDDGSLDPYTYAHLTDLGRRIDKALEAHYVLNGAGRRGR